FIADYKNHRIVKWKLNSKTGQIIAGENGHGNQINQFSLPTDIIVDKENNSFIVSDYGNKRVIRYFIQNQTNQQILISNINCWGLTIDKNGSIYVCDIWRNEVRRWKNGDIEGELVAGGNGRGCHLNQLNSPTYIFIDEYGSLYISDYENHRVMKWKKDAKVGEIVAVVVVVSVIISGVVVVVVVSVVISGVVFVVVSVVAAVVSVVISCIVS
ncbi:unnamed protein product, partial [Adineta steineri]